jgi:hypothetical protein
LDDGLEDSKAVFMMSLGTACFSIVVVSIVSIGLHHRFLLPNAKLPFVTLWGAVFLWWEIFYHYSLTHERKWARYERQFEHQSRLIRVLSDIGVWLTLFLLIVSAERAASIAWRLPS